MNLILGVKLASHVDYVRYTTQAGLAGTHWQTVFNDATLLYGYKSASVFTSFHQVGAPSYKNCIFDVDPAQ